MTSIVQYPGPGCVVEFLHGNRCVVAWVLSEQSGRFRVLTITQREMKLPAARLLPWSGPAHNAEQTREAIMETLRSAEERREALCAEVGPNEIWELAQGEVERAPVAWFAGLVWDEPDADQVAAMGRAILSHKTHFKFHPPNFEVYTAQTVERRQVEEQAREQREQIVSVGQTFFRALWEARTKGQAKPQDPDEELVETLKDVLFAAMADGPGSAELTIWNSLRKGLPDDPNMALYLAQTWGVVPAHFNAHLLREGYAWGDDWARDFDQDIEDARQQFEALTEAPEPTPFISIDSASTRDIDDAFFIERTDSGFRLQLALACPALTWNFDSRLDRFVRERASSLYLPEGTSHMLPEAYGLGLYSLTEQQPRPALVVDCALDETGGLISLDMRQSWVCIKANSTYEAMEESLESDTPAPHLALAAELGALLRSRRIDNGAAVVDRPDPGIVLEGEGEATRVEIQERPRYDRAQVAVSEFMILANTAVGQWAADNKLPLLFRTQDITLPGDAVGVWTTPEDAYRVVRHMAPTVQELSARKHATIGAKAYAPVTSPIRRYADLVNLAQVLSVLATGEPKWNKEELGLILPQITSRTEAAGRIQRFRPRYWKLVFFKQHKKDFFSAVAVDEGHLVTLALPREQFYIRAPRKMLGDKIYPGQHFQIRLNKIDPLANEIRLAEALEE